MKTGAIDVLLKPFNAQHLLEKVKKAIELDKQRPRINNIDFVARLCTLTSREKQIFDLILGGRLNKQIAIDLGISIKTVEFHRANVMQKLNVHSLAELLKLYYMNFPKDTAKN